METLSNLAFGLGIALSWQNVVLLPFLLDGVAGIPRLNQPDGVHPNLAGERIVADNVWKALKPVVVKLDRGSNGG